MNIIASPSPPPPPHAPNKQTKNEKQLQKKHEFVSWIFLLIFHYCVSMTKEVFPYIWPGADFGSRYIGDTQTQHWSWILFIKPEKTWELTLVKITNYPIFNIYFTFYIPLWVQVCIQGTTFFSSLLYKPMKCSEMSACMLGLQLLSNCQIANCQICLIFIMAFQGQHLASSTLLKPF